MNEEKEIEIIERYLQHQLSAEEVKKIEIRRETDADFNREVEEMKMLLAGIAYSGRKSLMDQLKAIDENLPEVTIHRPLRKLKWALSVAASILLTLGLYWLFSDTHNEKLYAVYFTPYDNVLEPVHRGNESMPGELQKGLMFYESNRFQEALPLLLKVYEEKHDINILFYLAITQLASDDPAEAIKRFESFLHSCGEDHVLKEPAQWNLALAYIKVNEELKAEKLLKEIKNNGSEFSEKSEELLIKMAEK